MLRLPMSKEIVTSLATTSGLLRFSKAAACRLPLKNKEEVDQLPMSRIWGASTGSSTTTGKHLLGALLTTAATGK